MVASRKWINGTSPDMPVGKVARRIIRSRLRDVRKLLDVAVRKRAKAEDVHQLRVATRRASSALQVFAEFVPRRRTRQMQRLLKRIRRAAGAARDLDVLVGRLKKAGGPQKWPLTLASLTKRRRNAIRPLRRIHQKLLFGEFRRRTRRLRKRVYWRGDTLEVSFSEFAHPMLRESLGLFFRKAADNLPKTEDLHELRITGKQVRYTMEILAGAFGPELRDQLYPDLARAQMELGAINDHATALRLFGDLRNDDAEKPLRNELNRLLRREQSGLDKASDRFRTGWSPDRVAALQKQFEEILDESVGSIVSNSELPI